MRYSLKKTLKENLDFIKNNTKIEKINLLAIPNWHFPNKILLGHRRYQQFLETDESNLHDHPYLKKLVIICYVTEFQLIKYNLHTLEGELQHYEQ